MAQAVSMSSAPKLPANVKASGDHVVPFHTCTMGRSGEAVPTAMQKVVVGQLTLSKCGSSPTLDTTDVVVQVPWFTQAEASRASARPTGGQDGEPVATAAGRRSRSSEGRAIES